MFGVKNYVNVYIFLRKHSIFLYVSFILSYLSVAFTYFMRTMKKCNIQHPSE